MNTGQSIVNVSVDKIIPSKFQPRLVFDMDSLQKLSASIREHGVIQPLIVRQVADKFEIIAGERRYKAAMMAGLSNVPVIVAIVDDRTASEIAVAENVQRTSLNPVEEAKSYKNMLSSDDISTISQRLGKTEDEITSKIKLLSLPMDVQDALINKKISEAHARSLLNVVDEKTCINLLNRVISERLTVKDLDEIIVGKTSDLIEETLVEIQDESTNSDVSNTDNLEEEISEDVKKNRKNLYDLLKKFESPSYPSLEDEGVNLETGLDSDNIFSSVESLEEVNEPILPEPEKVKVVIDESFGIDEDDLGTVKKAYQKVYNAALDKGFDISFEDYDFEDLYQIIIKVNKQDK